MFADFGAGVEEVAKSGGNARRLVEAPSGSGKTVLCIMLAARFVQEHVRAQKSRTAAGAAEVSGHERMLLLVHNEILCAEVANKVQAELRQASDSPHETILEPEIRAPAHPGIPEMA